MSREYQEEVQHREDCEQRVDMQPMTDLKPCPECGTMCEVEQLVDTTGTGSFYEQYTRHVTQEERIEKEKAKMLDDFFYQSMFLSNEKLGQLITNYARKFEQLKKEHGV